MSLLSRIWAAVFGPYMHFQAEKTEILMQRGFYGQLLISAQDDCYAIQVSINGEQAEELVRWLRATGTSLNAPKGKLIRLPVRSKVSRPRTDK